jgi:hypothetical protein
VRSVLRIIRSLPLNVVAVVAVCGWRKLALGPCDPTRSCAFGLGSQKGAIVPNAASGAAPKQIVIDHPGNHPRLALHQGAHHACDLRENQMSGRRHC